MASVIIAGVLPATAYAADGNPTPQGEEGICGGGWKKNIYGYKAKHHGKGPIYKDGPGGTIVVTRVKAGSRDSTLSGTSSISVSYLIAEAKQEVDYGSTKTASWGSEHQYRRNISKGKYGNVQYGSWGHTARWERYYELPNCKKSQRSSGPAKVMNNHVGFKYWQTSQ
ncbi:hypothetical protein [Streptomyces apocyni]|uniref:hypothetical protein n=1 Tax=Streptomyces apocyni TaxID=2654677 RepID=UPI001E5D33F7|nr:hypothetical protein [Streptomyces apocyni]